MENTYNLKTISNKNIVFSGFNDETLYNFLKNNNSTLQPIISNNTDLLIVDDIDKPYTSSKIKLAYKYKIPIIEKWEILKLLNIN